MLGMCDDCIDDDDDDPDVANRLLVTVQPMIAAQCHLPRPLGCAAHCKVHIAHCTGHSAHCIVHVQTAQCITYVHILLRPYCIAVQLTPGCAAQCIVHAA